MLEHQYAQVALPKWGRTVRGWGGGNGMVTVCEGARIKQPRRPYCSISKKKRRRVDGGHYKLRLQWTTGRM